MPVDARTTGSMLVLRRRTADAHRALEDQLDLLSPDLDLDRYGDVLVMLAAVYAPLEQAVAAAMLSSAAALVELAERRKVPALRADLTALSRPFPSPVAIPAIAGPAAALGALYVTEGATLGGALIAAHVADLLGESVPLAFFRAYGADVPLRWSGFRAVARDLLATPADVDDAADAAGALFAAFAAATVASQ